MPPPSLNLDHTFYVVFADHGDRVGIGETVVSDRRELIANAVAGELGYENIVAVTAFNTAEGWLIDATDDVQADIAAARPAKQDAEDFPVTARARERA